MKAKKILSGLLSASMAFTCFASTVSLSGSAADIDVSADFEDVIVADASPDIKVSYRTQDQIRKYFSEHPYDEHMETSYSSEPSASSPYSAGALDQKSLNNALNALNCIRYVAGLSSVKLNSNYTKMVQAAALVNCANNDLDHFPDKPSGMSNDLYELGKEGCCHSNLYWGSPSYVAGSVITYMEDSDNFNIGSLGHRRWCLNPKMKETGFGLVGNFGAMYAFDDGNSDAKQTNVCWPAQNMPVECFSRYSAWSISTGQYLDADEIEVTLKNKSNGKVWKFSQDHSDGDFYVDNAIFGQIGCIIFRPKGIYNYGNGESFDVTIEGAGDTINYNVEFFTLKVNSHLGDVNLDGLVDSSDASLILVDYASASTGKKSSFNSKQKKNADTNSDGAVDSSDASNILGYYAFISTGGNVYDMKDWMSI